MLMRLVQQKLNILPFAWGVALVQASFPQGVGVAYPACLVDEKQGGGALERGEVQGVALLVLACVLRGLVTGRIKGSPKNIS